MPGVVPFTQHGAAVKSGNGIVVVVVDSIVEVVVALVAFVEFCVALEVVVVACCVVAIIDGDVVDGAAVVGG